MGYIDRMIATHHKCRTESGASFRWGKKLWCKLHSWMTIRRATWWLMILPGLISTCQGSDGVTDNGVKGRALFTLGVPTATNYCQCWVWVRHSQSTERLMHVSSVYKTLNHHVINNCVAIQSFPIHHQILPRVHDP